MPTKALISKQRKRRESEVTKLLQSESRWLQKVLFGLGQAEDARERLAEVKSGAVDPLEFEVGEGAGVVHLESIRASVAERIEMLRGTLQERRATLPR